MSLPTVFGEIWHPVDIKLDKSAKADKDIGLVAWIEVIINLVDV